MRNDYVVVGRLTPLSSGEHRHRRRARECAHRPEPAHAQVDGEAAANLRNAAHRVADAIFEKIIGIRGAFATRIAYVSVDGRPPAQRYQLIVADADGEGPRMIMQSRSPDHVAGLVGRTASGSRTCPSSGVSPPCTCSRCARASAAWCRRAPASTARHPGRPTARSSRSRFRARTATSTSIYWISARSSSRA